MAGSRSSRLVPYASAAAVIVAALAYGLAQGANLPDDPSFAPDTAPGSGDAAPTSAGVPATAVADAVGLPRVARVTKAWQPTARPKRSGVEPFTSVSFRVANPVECSRRESCARPPRARRSTPTGSIVNQAAQAVLEWCALLADIEPERQVGLMDRTDLADHDGMIFQFERDSSEAFFMYQTKIPLSIAWFDGDGEYIGQADMVPCTEKNPRKCPLYPAGRSYRYAVEVPLGGLRVIGVGPGTVLSVGGACRA